MSFSIRSFQVFLYPFFLIIFLYFSRYNILQYFLFEIFIFYLFFYVKIFSVLELGLLGAITDVLLGYFIGFNILIFVLGGVFLKNIVFVKIKGKYFRIIFIFLTFFFAHCLLMLCEENFAILSLYSKQIFLTIISVFLFEFLFTRLSLRGI